MTSFPYAQFEGTPLWDCVTAAIEDLKKNDDLVIAAADRHVIGYLVQKVAQIVPAAVLTQEEAAGVRNAINEVCNGIEIKECEFQIRLGISRDGLSEVLNKI